jgi:hypothetical protein
MTVGKMGDSAPSGDTVANGVGQGIPSGDGPWSDSGLTVEVCFPQRSKSRLLGSLPLLAIPTACVDQICVSSPSPLYAAGITFF